MDSVGRIGERLYLTSLLDIDWDVFAQLARLTFGDGEVHLVMRIERIHCAVVRQSLLTPKIQMLGPECHVHCVDVSRGTRFLKQYLGDVSLLPSHIITYDANARTPTEAGFQTPYHISIVCASGDLDFVADLVELEEQ